LIDGYNVILRDPALRASFTKDREAGRACLVGIAGRYAALNNIRVVLVFDGGKTSEGRIVGPSPENVDVVFVSNADEYIRRRISRAGSRGSIAVISSDEGHIAGFSRRHGVLVLSAEAFLKDFREVEAGRKGEKVEGDDKPGRETRAGVEYWMERMGRKREE